jgi:hypothetical protein
MLILLTLYEARRPSLASQIGIVFFSRIETYREIDCTYFLSFSGQANSFFREDYIEEPYFSQIQYRQSIGHHRAHCFIRYEQTGSDTSLQQID